MSVSDWWGKTDVHVQKPIPVLLCHKSDEDCVVLNPGLQGNKVNVKFPL
jgi:hypothetical protein